MSSPPQLSANPFIATGQLFIWLLLYPTQWTDYLARVDPHLPPHFAFADLQPDQWRRPEWLQLQTLIFFVQPLWIAILIGFLLLISGKTSASIWLGITYGTLICWVVGSLSSLAISVAFGMLAGTLGGLGIGLLMGLTDTTENIEAFFIAAFVLGLTSHITATLPWQTTSLTRPLRWQWAGVMVGEIITVLVLAIGILVGRLLLRLLPGLQICAECVEILAMAVAMGMVLGFRLRDLRLGLVLGLFFGSLIAFLISLTQNLLPEIRTPVIQYILFGITGGTANAIVMVALFTLPYSLARHISNSLWASLSAGLLGGLGGYLGLFFYHGLSDLSYLFMGGLLCVTAGLTLKWWWSILMYPFEITWNLFLWWGQKRNPKQGEEWLRRHSAFWDKRQQLPLWGLETQLLWLSEESPQAGLAVMKQLRDGFQKWAVLATQVELDKRSLTQCRTIFDIANLHGKMLIGGDELRGVTGDWLHHLRHCSHQVETAISHSHPFQQHQALKNVANFLQGVLAGMKNRSEEERYFGAIAVAWQQLLDQYANELLEELPEIPNPYLVGMPLDSQHETFVGRTDLSKQIAQLLQPRPSPPLLLYGQRRTGKTSLLKNLPRSLADLPFILLFIDCQGPLASATDDVSFFYGLAWTIKNNEQPDFTFPPFSKDEWRDQPASHFEEWLDAVEKLAGNRLLLLALDEFMVLEEAFLEKRLHRPSLLGTFRHLMQHRPRCRWLFSGTQTFEELAQWATYLINVSVVHISYLSEREAHTLMEQPIKEFPLHYSQEAKYHLFSLTRGHPAFVQLMCHQMIQFKNAQRDRQRFHVTIEEVDKIIPQALSYGGFCFADIEINQTDDHGRDVLRQIAARGEGAGVSMEELQRQFPSPFEETLQGLIKREILEKRDDHYYRFQVELVRRWFVRER